MPVSCPKPLSSLTRLLALAHLPDDSGSESPRPTATLAESLYGEITALRDRVSELEDMERLFEYYCGNIPACVYVKDTESNYLLINKRCEELFNIKRADLKERQYTDFDFFNAEMAEQLRKNDRYVVTTGNTIETEEGGRPEGPENGLLGAGYRYYMALKFPLRQSDGTIIGVCGFSHDITKQKLMEAELQKANDDLKRALREIRTLRGILPLCAFCKSVRNDRGYWEQVDVYLSEHTDAGISHSICPNCLKERYPELTQEDGEA